MEMPSHATSQKVLPSLQTLTEEHRASFRLWLQAQLTDRCKKNARYSLRSFAKLLGMDASSLSQILSGKRAVSPKSMMSLCEKLAVTPTELKAFGLLKSSQPSEPDFAQISLDTFTVISEWYHYAILELTYVIGFKADPKWIARKLGISVIEAKNAVERLKRLELLIQENSTWVKSKKFLTNDSAVSTSGAHRALQKQLIEKALSAIDEVDAAEKDITSMTMAIDVQQLAKARTLIRQFRRDLCSLLEVGTPTQVYNLGIQLYPLSSKPENL